MAEKDSSSRREMETRLIERAWRDEAFASELRLNPKAVIEREVGKLPDAIQVHVVEESATSLYLVLPAKPSSSGKLSDAELETVAGGNTWDGSICY